MKGSYHIGEGRTYHRHFGGLRGVDLSSDPSEVSRSHFAMLENMWCDPVTLDGIAAESYPGYRIFARFDAKIHSIFRHRVAAEDFLIVHAGTHLYRFSERLRNFENELSRISPLSVTVADTRGCAFSYGENLCLLIGGDYLMIDSEGAVHSLKAEPELAYIPMTYFNGQVHEQRNLLSDDVRIGFTADGPYESVTEEDGLLFTVYNETEKTCSVRVSSRARLTGHVKIPASVLIGEEKYTVKAIGVRGFENMPGLVSIDIPPSVTLIGAQAFYGDTALFSVNLPSALSSIGRQAFFGCLSLEKLYLGGEALHAIGEEAFTLCRSLSEIRYGSTQENFNAIVMEGEKTLKDTTATVVYESELPYESHAVFCRYPLHESCLSLSEVRLGDMVLEENFLPVGDAYVRYSYTQADGLITAVEITATDKDILLGKTLMIQAKVSPIIYTGVLDGAPFGEEGKDAVCASTVVGKYDGRVFFTGASRFPNTVFYSATDDRGINNPFYIGCLNYFNDGTGAVPNRGLLVTGGLLAVLKADAGGEGEVFFHAPSDTQKDLIPRIYPVVASTPGVGLAGTTCRFADEALFLGKDGLLALTRCQNEGERALSPRSSAVNLRLLREMTENAEMAVFEGLLYLLCQGNVYLADARRRTSYKGSVGEYEWYLLTGIGAYAGDTPVYRYTSYLPERAEEYSLRAHPSIGEVAEGEIFSATLSTGVRVYYARTADGNFLVDTDGERTGGRFSPASCLCATDEALYFGTGDGAVGCFNTDKRGKRLYRPTRSDYYIQTEEGTFVSLNNGIAKFVSEDMITQMPIYRHTGSEYVNIGEADIFRDGEMATLVSPLGEREERGRVHRYYYSFAGHAYRAACALAPDDGDIPHFAKDSVAHSAAVKLKTPEGGAFSVFVRTDRHPFALCERISATTADAGDSDFSAFDFHSDEFATFPLREKERNWCFKQYLFESTGFRRPFGIFSLTYSYRLSGRIKP